MNIYLQTGTDFVHNGLGFLIDILEAKVEDNLNGDYSLIFEYKIDGKLSEYLVNENIVKCKVADGTNQLFIIKNVIKTFNSIQVTCKHIFYRLLDNFVEDTYPKNLGGYAFLSHLLNNTIYENNFIAHSDISTPKSARYVRRNPIDCILGDTDNSMVNLFGGELKRDNFDIHFNKRIGNNNGIKLIVGKNITGINITIDTNSVHTKIMPQGYDGLLLPEKYVNSPLINSYVNPKIYKVEFSDIKYDTEDESAYHDLNEAYEALRNAVEDLFTAGIDKPKINVKVDWIELSKTNEYKNYVNLERVNLGDTITIDLLGIQYQSRIIKTIYNPLNDKIETFEIGTPKANIGNSTNQILKQIEKVNPTSILEEAMKNATEQLTKAMGGYVYKTENELFIMNTNDVTTATEVWRWNLNGLGYSENGVNGPFKTAITQDGKIVADFITTGKLNTNVIEGWESLILSVSNKADLSTNGESNNAVLNFTNINESEPIEIRIRPINEDITYLYPADDLYPSDTLYMKDRTLRFTNTKTNEIFDYELPDDLLYYDKDNYDEFVLENGKCYINKKVEHTSKNGVNKLMATPTKIECEYPNIELTTGDYEVKLLGYNNGYIYCKLMIVNEYTKKFATKIEMTESIRIAKGEISSDINEKIAGVNEDIAIRTNTINQRITDSENSTKSELTTTINNAKTEAINSANANTTNKLKDYSTTTQMNNAITQKITESENAINLEVSNTYETKSGATTKANNAKSEAITSANATTTEKLKSYSTTEQVNAKLELKVGKNDNNQIVSMLNASASQIKIKSNRFELESDNLTIKADGTLSCKNAELTGVFNQYDSSTGKLAIKIRNQKIDFYDWKGTGEIVGSIASVTTENVKGIDLYTYSGKILYLGYKDSESVSDINTIFKFDTNNPNSTPWIKNTSSGTLFKTSNYKGIEVENGLIKRWNMPGTTGELYIENGDKIVTVYVEQGLIVNWTIS